MIREMKHTDIPAARALLSQLGYEMDGAEVERRFNVVSQKEDHGVFVVALLPCQQKLAHRCRLGDLDAVRVPAQRMDSSEREAGR
jgi:hypothetical protein